MVVVMGWAWWQHSELLPRQWRQGGLSLVFLVLNWMLYSGVKKMRRRLKKKHPMFFREKGEQADDES